MDYPGSFGGGSGGAGGSGPVVIKQRRGPAKKSGLIVKKVPTPKYPTRPPPCMQRNALSTKSAGRRL